MPKFRKRPVGIEAVQFHGDNFDEIRALTGYDKVNAVVLSDDPRIEGQVWDKLHSTWVGFGDGDWIIKGLKGEFYPCEAEVFAASYDEADERDILRAVLIPRARAALTHGAELNNLSTVDAVNHALMLYGFISEQRVVEGRDLAVLDANGDGQKVTLSWPGQEPAVEADSKPAVEAERKWWRFW